MTNMEFERRIDNSIKRAHDERKRMGQIRAGVNDEKEKQKLKVDEFRKQVFTELLKPRIEILCWKLPNQPSADLESDYHYLIITNNLDGQQIKIEAQVSCYTEFIEVSCEYDHVPSGDHTLFCACKERVFLDEYDKDSLGVILDKGLSHIAELVICGSVVGADDGEDE